MVMHLRTFLRGLVARVRVRRELLRYVGAVLAVLPRDAADGSVRIQAAVARLRCDRRPTRVSPSNMRWLFRVCHELRKTARRCGVARLRDVRTVEVVFEARRRTRHGGSGPASPPSRRTRIVWTPAEREFFEHNVVVRSWVPLARCRPRLAGDIDLLVDTATPTVARPAAASPPPPPPPPPRASKKQGKAAGPGTDMTRGIGLAWTDGAGVITRYRGIRLAWGAHVVYGYIRHVPIGVMDATFPQATARVRHISAALGAAPGLEPKVAAAVVRDLGPREVLVMSDEAICEAAHALQRRVRREAETSLRSVARDMDRLDPVELVRHIYSIVATAPEGRPRTLARIMYEFVCVRNAHAVPGVGATIRACLPPELRGVVCQRMIGIGGSPPPGAGAAAAGRAGRLGGAATEAELPLPERVRLRFEDSAPAVLDAARDRLREYRESRPGSDTQGKAAQYLESLLRLPLGRTLVHPVVERRQAAFGKGASTSAIDRRLRVREKCLTTLSIPRGGRFPPRPTPEWRQHWDSVREFRRLRAEQRAALAAADAVMDETVHGCKPAKRIVRQLVAQWVGNDAGGCVIGLEGPPGVGKTTLVREGLARCFGTRGKPHPFEFISLGGSTSNSTLVGWTYTWHTSSYGKIAGALMRHGAMNPILYFDELDKVSRTNEGREIIGILTHLTDATQNKGFEDRYFAGVPLDLSRCIIVFSYNDPKAIDPVLLDRVQRIRIDPMTTQAKVAVAKDFVLPKICDEVGVDLFRHYLPDAVLKHIAERYTREAGVRRLKELLYTIVRERNRRYLIADHTEPIVGVADVERILADARPSRINRVGSADETAVGAINALYAGAGGGGVIPVQVACITAGRYRAGSGAGGKSGDGRRSGDGLGAGGPPPAWSRVAPRILLTGQQGDVMMEAAQVAATVAAILAGKPDPEPPAFHLHCPDGATPKDGPSAGMAFTLAFLSALTRRPIRQNLALTGEIDLLGRVLVIGGVAQKLAGGLMHGVEVFILPEANRSDAEKYVEHSPLPPGVFIHYVSTIQEAIKIALKDP